MKMKEQSSVSNQKIVLPNKDLVGLKKEKKKDIFVEFLTIQGNKI